MEHQVGILTQSQELIQQINQALRVLAQVRLIQMEGMDNILEIEGINGFDVILLDTGINDISFRSFHDVMVSQHPGVRWLVLPPEDEDKFLPLLGFLPDGYLSRPFDPSELIEQLEEFFHTPVDPQDTPELAARTLFEVPPPDPVGQAANSQAVAVGLKRKQSSAQATAPTQPRTLSLVLPGFENPDILEQSLVSLLELAGAQAVLVTRGDQLVGYSSQLASRAKPELIQWLYQSGAIEARGEMIGYVPLVSTGQNHLVYVLKLEEPSALTMVFAPGTSFKQARGSVASLFNPPPPKSQPDSVSTSTLQLDETLTHGGDNFVQGRGVGGKTAGMEYVILMIPHIPSDRLVGVIASSLVEWMHQISLIHNWRFENLSIQPEYILWTTWVDSAKEIEKQVRVFRHYTSIRLSSFFPDMALAERGPDFWSATHLQISGGIVPEQRIIYSFIERIRHLD